MTFNEILSQTIEMLNQHGRVSYRALKRQFDIDDDYLGDLRDELIDVQEIAVDQEGRILVLRGEAERSPEPISQPDPLSQSQPISEPARTVQETSAPVDAHVPDAERRQLTVMFCDLVDSTSLSGQLDPEDLRDVIRAYQDCAAGVIQRYEGYIAQYLGDGLLVYFGWPRAHEDDAHRAVHAGRSIIEAVTDLNQTLETGYGVQLAVRLGIHTGSVVVGEVGSGDRRENLALGETPNIAARLEGLAAYNHIVISASTRRLLGQAFDLNELGQHQLKGVADPVSIYSIVGQRPGESRFESARLTTLTPMVGREEEIGLILSRWDQAKIGEGQAVLLSGEPGIGKSRCLQAVCDRLEGERHMVMRFQCSPYHTNTAFYPITEQFAMAAGFTREDTADLKLDKLETHLDQVGLAVAEAAPLFAAALSIPTGDRYSPLNMSPQQQKDRTMSALVDRLLAASRQHPLLFIAEDLHWSDPTSLETIGRIIERIQDANILMICTHRPGFISPWGLHGFITTLSLNRLSRLQSESLVTRLTGGKSLPSEVADQILSKSDGIPLFVEEVTKSLLESEWLEERDGHYELVGSLPPMAIPSTLQDALMARLDQMHTAKDVAQLGAILGREFSYEILQAISELDETTLQRELNQLVEAELVYQRGLPPRSTYIFKHALIQDTAYESLLRSTRHNYHRRIAEVLEERFPDTAETQPELVAHHYTEAGLIEQAIPSWQRAGEYAGRRSAHVESIAHLMKALELLNTLTDSLKRAQRELTLQVALGRSLMIVKGYGSPEAGAAYDRARELSQRTGDYRPLFSVLRGLVTFYYIRAEYRTARELGEQCLTIAQQMEDPSRLIRAYCSLGLPLFYQGEFELARSYLEQSVTLAQTQSPNAGVMRAVQDVRVTCLLYFSQMLMQEGYADQAEQWIQEACVLAEKQSHPFSQAEAMNFRAVHHFLRREPQLSQRYAESAIALSAEHGFPHYLSHSTIYKGWALAMQGDPSEGAAQIQQGLASWRSIGGELARSAFLTVLAQAYQIEGKAEEGLSVLAEALRFINQHSEHFWETEAYRLKGELLLQQSSGNAADAESCFHQAMSIAQHQSAKSWELRSATSLAHLWQSQDKHQDAYDLLAPVYNWFTEGFDTTDLQEAKALLAELSG